MRFLLAYVTRHKNLWDSEQEKAFKELKHELTRTTVLALYDRTAKSKVSADVSSFGLGAVLLQENKEGEWRLVAYASRSLSETERRCAQIENEALALTWSCEKFSDYILGSRFEIETDHKPLVPILSSKHLNDLPPRVLRFRLRMAKFDYRISHVPGKLLYTADTLSRDPILEQEQTITQEEMEMFVNSLTKSLPASEQRLEAYHRSQEQDEECTQVREYCRSGWPSKQLTPPQLLPYWKVRDNLTICNNLLLYNSRIVVPKSMQRKILQKIHSGHLRIDKCKKHTAVSVWWPGVMQQIAQRVQNCGVCAKLWL